MKIDLVNKSLLLLELLRKNSHAEVCLKTDRFDGSTPYWRCYGLWMLWCGCVGMWADEGEMNRLEFAKCQIWRESGQEGFCPLLDHTHSNDADSPQICLH